MKTKLPRIKNDLEGIETGIFITLIIFVALVAACFFEYRIFPAMLKWGWI
jgi:hypothetical protein